MPPQNPLIPSIVEAEQSTTQVTPEGEQDKMFDFTTARIHLKRLSDDWAKEIADTEIRRNTRKVDINVEALRQSGKLDEDETIIPVRVIDTNIQREQPPYVNYFKNSRRLGIFKCVSSPKKDCETLEAEFTRVMTYVAWELSYFKIIDGFQTHGWDAVEVVYDQSKPGNCAIEHIGHDMLLFPKSTKDLQQAPRLSRIYDVTFLQLDAWVEKYGFDAEQVQRLKDVRKNTQKETETYRIFKHFFKSKGVVYTAWYCLDGKCSDWLKKPVQHFVGIKEQIDKIELDPQTNTPKVNKVWQDKPTTMYPIFNGYYRETEEALIMEHKGRVFLDENKQEAQTAILSGYVNGLTRASNIYGSPAQEDGTGATLKELENLRMTPGRVFNRPVQFWHPDYPDPTVLSALKYFDIANSQETNQVNFAVNNRVDSRKTAKEITSAENQQAVLSSVQLTLFSILIRQVLGFSWLIVQSQALQNEIQFLMVEKSKPQVNPLTGQPIMDETGQPVLETEYVNDFESLKLVYDVRAAGDVDVIQKEETIQKMQQDWPIVSATILKDQFLQDYIRLKYPEDADKYIEILKSQAQLDMCKGLAIQLGTVLQGELEKHPEDITALPQQQQKDLATMMQSVQSLQGQTPPK